ncbi:AI-2E family transporter [Haloarcula pelagica]|uniref:AI-2E family transporter n=1 Tax=Haloarcula pelagica TaxID=3033389 RepID=UPI0024C3C25D|nr:AI-2E family transporter [Halomicroarcula sp. YJ-61-S]
MSRETLGGLSRSRAAWWLLAAGALGVVGFVAWTLVGPLVLGLGLYYAARPLARRLQPRLPDGVAAALPLFGLLVPALAVVTVLVAVGLQELSAIDGRQAAPVLDLLGPYVEESVARNPRSLLRDPTVENLRRALTVGLQVAGAVMGGVLRVTLAFALAFFLLRDDDRVADWLRTTLGPDSEGYAFARRVDSDLHTVYFGNVLTVLIVTIVATLFYNGFNLVAPQALTIPLPTVLGIATGFATFVPIVVGKFVYVPVALSIVARALVTDGTFVGYVVGFVVGAFVLLDVLPVMGIRPYLSGRDLHGGAMMFAYVLGTVLFGWAGLFLGPLLLVGILRVAHDVLPALVRRERVAISGGDPGEE